MDGPERSGPGEPPADPDAWTDEQWLAWLEAIDADQDDAGHRPARRGARRKPARMLGNAMVGLHEVIYRKREEAAVVAEAGGDPPRDDEPEVHLDPDHPERSEVVIRRRAAPAGEDGAS